jgi:hypothetical protein
MLIITRKSWAAPCVFGGSGTYVIGISGELCFSLNNDRKSMSGIWTLCGAFSIGAAAESHMLYTETRELYRINIPCAGS